MGIVTEQHPFKGIYNNKRVLITGHTGFKGSWLALWLLHLGAKVTGYSLQPSTEPNHFQLLNMDIKSEIGDIRDADKLKQIFKEQKPDIVFHLAAQAIVRHSYIDPVETFSSNVTGTINVFEASREIETVRAIVNVTSDKCYENKEWTWGYREIDALGGYDPYSASKGCAEIITGCWQKSFFNPRDYGKTHQTLLSSARAGNVIGGGDWATDRLIPDIMRAIHEEETVDIRNPQSIRPWQHVLEPLHGYLMLGQKLIEGEEQFAQAWNFGPSDEETITVEEITKKIKDVWPAMDYKIAQTFDQPHEAGMLKLDCSRARQHLKWKPLLNCSETIQYTTEWYKEYYTNDNIISSDQLKLYESRIKDKMGIQAN